MAGFSESFVKRILLTGRAGRRMLNESSVQTNVWVSYAALPLDPLELLITPLEDIEASRVARSLYLDLSEGEDPFRQQTLRTEMLGEPRRTGPRITPLQGVVAAEFDFMDFLGIVLPKTGFDLPQALQDLRTLIITEPQTVPLTMGGLIAFFVRRREQMPPRLREALLVLLIAAAAGDAVATEDENGQVIDVFQLDIEQPGLSDELWAERALQPANHAIPVPLELMLVVFTGRNVDATIRRVGTNRNAEPTMISIETIKADAAQRVFDISCDPITWAVIDSGIDGSHPAFRDHATNDGSTRIDKAYDFGQLRNLAAYDRILDDGDAQVSQIAKRLNLSAREARKWLGKLRDDALEGRPFDWEMLSRLLEVDPDRPPLSFRNQTIAHGTHVAGVLGGDWRDEEVSFYRGVCPDIRLYDLRVLGDDAIGTEFAVIAALEFIRWLNGRNRYTTIHGANLSLGLRHDLDQHACGRTPVCMACEATVNSGVVVVAAAGNWGAESHETLDGTVYAGYAATSISDPGNAASVITVGATHRERPHEYGVSFFSSRGPTGDGRAKPDVVAPGEQIDGPLPDLGFGRLDGTSMAAPHVSGVAALLMARHPEMAGDPNRVKAVIMATATDLGRVREFQGAGLVDALRALQSV